MKRKTLRRKRQARKTRKRRGGVKLGEGGFGRVYAPGILCNGTPAEVTKVFTPTSYFTHEAALSTIERLKPISAKLKEIDPKHEFFLYPEFCEGKATLSEENIADGLTGDGIGLSYNMKRGETSVARKYRAEIDRAIFIANDIEYTEDQEDENPPEIRKQKTAQYREEAERITETLLPMFKGVKSLVQKLHSENILHRDLNPANVVVMKDGSYRLIDFDMSVVREEDELLANEKRKEIRGFILACLIGWNDVYPDLYTRIVNA